MEFGSTQIIKESVEAGLGISFLSRAAVRKEIALGTLREPDVEGFPFTRKFSLITRTAPFYTKAMEVFMELLRRSPPFRQNKTGNGIMALYLAGRCLIYELLGGACG